MSYEPPRQYVRIERVLDFRYTADGQEFEARIADLGEGGAFIDCDLPLEVGQRLDFRFTIPEENEVVEGRAKVVWQQPTVGMGIEFLDLTEDQRRRIRYFVAAVFFRFSKSD